MGGDQAQTPGAAPADAPAATTTGTPAPATTATAPATDTATAPAGDASYVPMKPTPGVGQPVDGGWNFQPQVSPVGGQAFTFSHYVLLPVVSGISLLVLGLLLWVIFRYRAGANPVPSKTTHNTLIADRKSTSLNSSH